MSILSDHVNRMVECGMDQDEAMQMAAELFAAGVASAATRPSSGALRTRKWRHKTSQNVTGDAEQSEKETVTERHETSQSVTCDKAPRENTNSKKPSRRGSRISDDWTPSAAERELAKQEGYSDSEVDREALRFRDYWISASGSKAVKHDWSATWRNWVRNGADRTGKAPKLASTVVNFNKFYAKADSEQILAWDQHLREKTGKGCMRDKNGGWYVDSEWPPDYVPQPKRDDYRMTPAPLRRME